MPPKSNNDKKKEAEAAGRAPKCVLHSKPRLAHDNRTIFPLRQVTPRERWSGE